MSHHPSKISKRHFLHFQSISNPGRLASWRLVSASSMMSPAGQNPVCTASRARSTRYTCLLPQPIPIPQWRFAHLHIDLVGPLQYSSDCNHIFTIIDRTSKWMEAIPLSETSAAECARALVFSWITCFGVPKTITSDRGLQFTSNVW